MPKFIVRHIHPRNFVVVDSVSRRSESVTPTTGRISEDRPLSTVIASRISAQPVTAVAQPILTTRLTTMPVGRLESMSLIKDIRLANPAFAKLIASMPWKNAGKGTSRDKLNVPICMDDDVTDEVLFEDPKNPSKKYYVPRYRIEKRKVSGNEEYKIELSQSDQGGRLTVYLEAYKAPKIEESEVAAEELNPRAAKVTLEYMLPIGDSDGFKINKSFQEVKVTQTGLKAVLRLKSLEGLTQIRHAISNVDYKASLIIRQVITVAVPVKPTASEGVTQVSSGTGTLKGTFSFDFDAG